MVLKTASNILTIQCYHQLHCPSTYWDKNLVQYKVNMCTYMYILDRMCVAPIQAYTLHMCIYYVCSAIAGQEVDK